MSNPNMDRFQEEGIPLRQREYDPDEFDDRDFDEDEIPDKEEFKHHFPES